MKHIYLCGHTGSQNRGCEAIIRSTAQIFRDIGVDNITVFTFDEEADQRCGLGQVTSLCPYPSLSMPKHVYSYARRKLLSDGVWGHRHYSQCGRRSVLQFSPSNDQLCAES